MTYKIKITCLKCSLLLLFLQIWLLLGAQNKFAPIDAWLHQNIQGLGGRAVLVLYQDGKMVYAKAVNQLSRRQQLVGKLIARKRGIDKDEALQDFGLQTRQRIASCSKWLSAALVMSFVDEGQLLLTDTIGRFLPLLSAKGKGRITIAHCLSHLTGIQAPPLKASIGEMGKVPDMDSAVRMIADMPIEGAPGKVFNYSNSGLQLAAAVIEKISGKDFETLFQERIAVPCGMTNTDFGHGPVPLAAGGAFSTPIDYLQFLEMILHDGLYRGKRVLSAQSVAAMQRNYTAGAAVAHTPAEAANWGYGLGHWVMEEAEPRSRAVTSPGLFGSFPWVDNQLGYAGFLFTMNLHSKGRNERYRALKRLVDEALR